MQPSPSFEPARAVPSSSPRGAQAASASSPSTDWRAGVRDLTREHTFESLRIEGTIPADLEGTMYRAGPALFAPFGRKYNHWFDGDGAISAVRFHNGAALGGVKLVDSAARQEEQRKGRSLYGGYGTRGASWFREAVLGRRKNAANTSVMSWQGRLFALFEGGRPTEISPDSLATFGESTIDGVVIETFSAHPHAVTARKALYNFGMRYGKQTLLDIFELPARGAARRLASIPLSATTMIHDFIATERHLIFFAPPLRVRLLPLILGIKSYSDSLQWSESEGTEVLVVPIDDPGNPIRFTTTGFFQWHFANAFERNGEIVVDLVKHPNFDSNAWLRSVLHDGPDFAWPGRYARAVIDLGRRSMRIDEPVSLACEFPQVATGVQTRPHRFVYAAAYAEGGATQSGIFDRLAKIDLERASSQSFSLGDGRFPGEPLFVPRRGGGGEDDGYLVSLVYDAPSHTSHVAVLDAREPDKGVLARAWFDHHVPMTFHGVWVGA